MECLQIPNPLRRFVVLATCLILCVRGLCAAEPSESVTLFSDGFAPTVAPFRIVFLFSAFEFQRPDAPFPRAMKEAAPAERKVPFVDKSVLVWRGKDVAAQLDICALNWPVGLNDYVLAAGRLRLENTGGQPFSTTLSVFIAPRPAIHALAFERHAFFMEGKPICIADTPSRGASLAESAFAARPLTPQDTAHVESADGTCTGEMLYDLTLAPGQSQVLGFICPIHLPKGADPKLDFYRALSVEDLFTAAEKQVGGSKSSQ